MSELLPERVALRQMLRSNPGVAEKLREMLRDGRLQSVADADPNERMAVLCVPWADRSVSDCTRATCQGCRQDVSLSPSTVEMLEKHPGPADVVCMECFQKARALSNAAVRVS